MVQEFHVLRCFSCQSFQVHQVKKVSRWSCKLCGEKQSLLKEFGRGSGADCRRHVQKLNSRRGAMMQDTWLLRQQEEETEEEPKELRDNQTQVSCWSKYLDTPEEAGPEEQEEDLMDRQQLYGNNMIDRKRKREGLDSWSPDQCSRPSSTSRTTSSPGPSHSSSPGPSSSRPPGLKWSSSPGPSRSSPPGPSSSRPPGLKWSSSPGPSRSGPPGPSSSRPPGLKWSSSPGPSRSGPPGPSSSRPPGLKWSSSPGPSRSSSPGPSSSRPPGLKWFGSSWFSLPSKKSFHGTHYLSGDCQVTEEREGPSVDGRSHSVGGVASLSCCDIIYQTQPLIKPRPLLPVSSMFQSGDDFSLDD